MSEETLRDFGVNEVVNDMFNLDRPPIDQDTSFGAGIRYLELPEASGNGYLSSYSPFQRNLRFRLSDMSSWVNMHRAWFRLQLKMVNRDGSNLAAPAAATAWYYRALINDPTCIFKRLSMIVNTQPLENKNQHVAQGQWVLNLLSDLNTQKKRCQGSLYEYGYYGGDSIINDADAPISHNRGTPIPNATSDNYNPVFAKRALRHVRLSQTNDGIELLIPLNRLFDFFRDPASDHVVKNCVFDISCEIESDGNIIDVGLPATVGVFDITANTDAGVPTLKWVKEGATLVVPVYTPALPLISKMNDKLKDGGLLQRFTYLGSQCFQTLIPANTTVFSGQISQQISKPRMIYVWFAYAGAETDTLSNNTFLKNRFLKHGIETNSIGTVLYPESAKATNAGDAANGRLLEISAHLNGYEIPYQRYQLNTASGKLDQLRAFRAFLEDEGHMNADSVFGSIMDFEDWYENYPIFTFNANASPVADAVFRGGTELIIKFTCENTFSQAAAGTLPERLMNMYTLVTYDIAAEFRMSQYTGSILIQ